MSCGLDVLFCTVEVHLCRRSQGCVFREAVSQRPSWSRQERLSKTAFSIGRLQRCLLKSKHVHEDKEFRIERNVQIVVSRGETARLVNGEVKSVEAATVLFAKSRRKM